MPNDSRIFLALGAASTIAAILLGSAAAHLPNEQLAASQALYQPAMQYHQLHALGLMIIGLAAGRFENSRWLRWSGWLMLAGTLLFSGNLYLRSFLGFHELHAITPYGGLAFLLAWLFAAIGVLRHGRGATSRR